jgi:mRNA interferase MazF
MGYKQGEIVLVPFPYSDLSGSKRRPVLVVSNDLFDHPALREAASTSP